MRTFGTRRARYSGLANVHLKRVATASARNLEAGRVVGGHTTAGDSDLAVRAAGAVRVGAERTRPEDPTVERTCEEGGLRGWTARTGTRVGIQGGGYRSAPRRGLAGGCISGSGPRGTRRWPSSSTMMPWRRSCSRRRGTAITRARPRRRGRGRATGSASATARARASAPSRPTRPRGSSPRACTGRRRWSIPRPTAGPTATGAGRCRWTGR